MLVEICGIGGKRLGRNGLQWGAKLAKLLLGLGQTTSAQNSGLLMI